MRDNTVRAGQRVVRTPVTFGAYTSKMVVVNRPMAGEVVYVHPKGRFHVVGFPDRDGIREAFQGVMA